MTFVPHLITVYEGNNMVECRRRSMVASNVVDDNKREVTCIIFIISSPNDIVIFVYKYTDMLIWCCCVDCIQGGAKEIPTLVISRQGTVREQKNRKNRWAEPARLFPM